MESRTKDIQSGATAEEVQAPLSPPGTDSRGAFPASRTRLAAGVTENLSQEVPPGGCHLCWGKGPCLARCKVTGTDPGATGTSLCQRLKLSVSCHIPSRFSFPSPL